MTRNARFHKYISDTSVPRRYTCVGQSVGTLVFAEPWRENRLEGLRRAFKRHADSRCSAECRGPACSPTSPAGTSYWRPAGRRVYDRLRDSRAVRRPLMKRRLAIWETGRGVSTRSGRLQTIRCFRWGVWKEVDFFPGRVEIETDDVQKAICRSR